MRGGSPVSVLETGDADDVGCGVWGEGYIVHGALPGVGGVGEEVFDGVGGVDG